MDKSISCVDVDVDVDSPEHHYRRYDVVFLSSSDFGRGMHMLFNIPLGTTKTRAQLLQLWKTGSVTKIQYCAAFVNVTTRKKLNGEDERFIDPFSML
jgi:hypothetical protein